MSEICRALSISENIEVPHNRQPRRLREQVRYDMECDMTWHGGIIYDMTCDMTWHGGIIYDMTCDMTCDMTWWESWLRSIGAFSRVVQTPHIRDR